MKVGEERRRGCRDARFSPDLLAPEGLMHAHATCETPILPFSARTEPAQERLSCHLSHAHEKRRPLDAGDASSRYPQPAAGESYQLFVVWFRCIRPTSSPVFAPIDREAFSAPPWLLQNVRIRRSRTVSAEAPEPKNPPRETAIHVRQIHLHEVFSLYLGGRQPAMPSAAL